MKCAYCELESEELHRDHVVPRSRGGPDNATNIVMACQKCNSAKRDKTASEWLGDRCPSRVLLIEIQVNTRMEKSFKGRDDKRKPAGKFPFRPPEKEPTKLYAFHIEPSGKVGYMGEVVSEHPGGLVRMEVADGMALCCGFWSLTGMLVDLPRSECRLFNDRDCCCDEAGKLMDRTDRKSRQTA